MKTIETTRQESEQVPLPPGWHIEPTPGVGVTCLSGTGLMVDQHPRDDAAFRRLCWDHYYALIAKAVGTDKATVERIVAILTGEERI